MSQLYDVQATAQPQTSADITVNSSTETSDGKYKVEKPNTKNILNDYRSYNYIFTLGALTKEALDDPTIYRGSDNYFVIAKSSGKGTAGLKTPSDPQAASLVSDFNTKSAGRFDFYIDHVHISTITSFNQDTGASLATKLEFDIVEPYSMTGLLEALQASAVASGHDQYISTPYVLKMEFIGYPDSISVEDSEPVSISEATRYFVFSFTGIEMSVNEEGTKYKCSGVPHNERGYGEPTKLKSQATISGNTVGDILSNLESALNTAMEEEAVGTNGPEGKNKHDTYQIIVPKFDSDKGIVENEPNEDILKKKLVELLKSNSNFKFPDPGAVNNEEATRIPLMEATVSFSDGHSVTDCITSIIVNSDYTREIISDFVNRVDSYGMVNYFTVTLEVTEIGEVNSSTRKPYYNYKFIVLPYKVHYTRIPLAPTDTIDPTTKKLIANREYDYLYSGSNLDVLKFNLNFNTLFFQAIPKALGNKAGVLNQQDGVEAVSQSSVELSTNPYEKPKQNAIGNSPVQISSAQGTVQQGKEANAGAPNTSPYGILAKNLHQAILDNVDQCTAEMEIIGDPFFLMTSGIGNYRPKQSKFGMTIDGEASFTTGEVMIIITFRNPIDIDTVTGEAIFDDAVTAYSGLFKVISVENKFNGGVFTQSLSLIRLPSQIENTKKPYVKNTAPLVDSTPNPEQDPSPAITQDPFTIRAASTDLAASIASGNLPANGLPGAFSNLVTGIGGGLAGFAVGATAVGALVSQAGASISSAIRLTSAGLSSLSSNVLGVGAAMSQVGALASSIGISNTQNLADTTLAANLSSTGQIGSNAMSSVYALGPASNGLISNVSANVDSITNPSNSSDITGLSSNVASNYDARITAAVANIPSDTNINDAANNGLIIGNISSTDLANLPSSQLYSTSPKPDYSVADVQTAVDRGGSPSLYPGSSTIPEVAAMIAAKPIPQLPMGLGLDSTSAANKLSVAQDAMNRITGQPASVESKLNLILAAIPTGQPNTASVEPSAVSKYGSASTGQGSPLATLMKSNA